MRVINSNYSLLPYFNLASEDYFLESNEDIFMLWRNGRSVIIGKNQNAYSEVNIPFCEKNGITVARRLTGGGAVFHDKGNVNFSFICDKSYDGMDFLKFINPIIEALSAFGIKAEADGRNDITANGFKISGNAQCVRKTKDGRERVLHHGTLLFSADISDMTGALNVRREKLEAKGVKSVSSRVKNIVSLDGYIGPDTPEDFMTAVLSSVADKYGTDVKALTVDEITAINEISQNSFAKWEWNFGCSPSYKNNVYERFSYGTVEIGYSASGGKIDSVKITGDFFGEGNIEEIEKGLTGVMLDKHAIEAASDKIGYYIKGALPSDISHLILEK